MSLLLLFAGSGVIGHAGLVYRYQDASNHWRAYVDRATHLVRLERILAGVVATVATGAWDGQATTELMVMTQGDRHRVWSNGILVIDEVDGALNTATAAGLYSADSPGEMAFDDFYVEGL